MSFFAEAARALGIAETALAEGYNLVDYDGKAVYIEGIKRVLKLSDEEIKLELNGAVMNLRGNGLEVFDLNGATLIVRGEIIGIDFEARKKERANAKKNKKSR